MTEKNKKRNTTGLKVISIMMAILLWFYVINQGQLATPDNIRDVGLEYRNLEENLTVIGPERVNVRLWGAFQEAAQIEAFVDLSGLTAGTYTVPVQVEQQRGAMITTVEPDMVEIEIQEVGQNTFPINYEIRQNPPTGFEIADVLLSADRCLVQGQQEEINRISIITAPLDLSNVTDITTLRTQLVARDVHGNTISDGIQIIPETITAYVAINVERESKQVPVLADFAGELVPGYQIDSVSLEPDSVSIIGEKRIIDETDELTTQTINLDNRDATFSKTIDLETPEGARAFPSNVVITVYIEGAELDDEVDNDVNDTNNENEVDLNYVPR
ncbi:hypothetical protein SYNTR_2287 [Candidatus Syntrophocurvum alkaliphilum]|uniref:Secreted protein associated with spyDAC n=1 Tax=Candidatus Syntrophocurvum alkaliphilum TaxID=2293317 RepID=A0A6I6DPK9_9FIRM|nr:CdaR family protein [Candidatus Syntrophocurvum alkaliphilum]QGU00881.1 hypothetical protein SYNTR_2287 [Candidatus Syntrophocurvum alkaliphilum]